MTRDPFNPYANYYLANHYDLKGKPDSAAYYFQQIATAPNFAPWWYTREAEGWIEEYDKADD